MSNIKGIVSLLVFVAAMTWISARLYNRKVVFVKEDVYDMSVYYNSYPPRMFNCGTRENVYNPNYRHEPGSPDGEKLFKANCASCHHPTKVVIGPALVGVTKRWTAAGIRNKMYDWINNPKGTYDLGIPYIKKQVDLNTANGVAMMTAQPLNKEEIDAVLNYIEVSH